MSYRDRLWATYEAEWATFTSAKVNRPLGIAPARAMVRRHLPGWKVVLAHDQSNGMCYCYERLIEIGRRSPAWIVAHEIAHGLADAAGAPPGHHDAFRHCYVEVVREEVGAYWARKLSQSFTQRNLGIRPAEARRTPRLYTLILRVLGRL